MKKRIISMLLVIVMVLSMLPTAFAEEAAEPVYGPIGENLIANGGFEEVDANGKPTNVSVWYSIVDPWGNHDGWGTKAFLETDPANVYEGSNSLHLVDTEVQWSRFGMTAAVQPNKSYVFSFKAKGTSDAPLTARIVENGVEYWVADENKITPNADEWTTLTYVYNAGNTYSLDFEINAVWNNMNVYIDDVSLYEYGDVSSEPEPEPEYGIIGENLIANGGFETLNDSGYATGITIDGFDGDYGWGKNAVIVNDAIEGENALSLTGDLAGATRIFFGAAVEPGKTYLYTFKVKGSVVNSSGAAASVGSDIEQFSNGAWIGSNSSTGSDAVTPVPDEWTTMEHLYIAPENVNSVNFATFLPWIEGTVLFDDFGLYEWGVIGEEEPEEPENPWLSYVTDSVDGVNWIRNNAGTFENGWDFGVWEDSEIVTDEAGAFEGSAYAKLNAAVDGASQIGVVAVTLPTPGVEVKIVAMVKGDAGNLTLHLQHYRNDNSHIGNDNSNVVALEASDDWYQVVFTPTLPADVGGTTGGGTEVYLIYSGEGTICIDDVQFFYPIAEEEQDILDQIPDEIRYPDFNGSFEELNDDGSPKNWRMAPGGCNGGTWTLTEDATDGSWAATATYANTDTHVFMDNQVLIPVIEGATYRLTADLKNQTGGSIGFDIQQVNSALETVSLTGGCGVQPSEEWQSASTEIVIVEGAVGLYLRPGFAYNAGTVTFDNIKLEVIAVPEGYDPNAPVVPDEPAEPPVNVTGDNLIYNGDIEELDENGQPVGIGAGGMSDFVTPGWGTTVFLETEKVYEGENALKISLDQSGWAYAGFDAEVEGEVQYLLTITALAETAGLSVGADYDFWDADGNHLFYSSTGADGVTAEVGKWTTMTHLVTAPAGAASMSINVSVPWTIGTIIFDNLSLYKVTQNLVVNGSFEKLDENGQPADMIITGAAGNKFGEKVFIETNPDNVYEGSKALKIVHEESDWNCANMHAYVKPNTSYLLTYKAKGTDGLTIGADLCMWRDDSGNVSTSYIRDQGTGADNVTLASNNWNTFQHILTTPDECGYMEIAISIPWTVGTLYVDDVSLVEMGSSFPFFAKLHLDEKMIYTGTESSFTEVYFYEAYNADENYTVDFALTDAEGTVIAEAAGVVPVEDYTTFTYDLTGLEKATQYIVTANVIDKSGNVLETLSDDIYIYDRPTALNENMEFVEEDGSIFHPAYAYWGPETSEDYARLAAAGVNVVLWSPPGSWTIEQQLADLDLLHSLGMKANVVCFWGMLVAGHPTNREGVSAWVEQLKDHPAVYCWSLADEPFLDTSEEMRDNMEYGYHMIRAIDPVHPITYVHCNYNHGLDEMHYFSDIILVDTYPGPYFPMESHVADKLVTALEAIDYHRPVLQLIQAFTHMSSRPTQTQFHNMFYQNFLAGGQGVGWFGFGGSGRVGSGDGPMVPVEWSDDLWPVFESIYATGEYDIVFEHYSSGVEPTVAASREENVWYDVWEADGTYYAVVQNRTKSEQSVDIALPFAVESIAQISEISGEAVAVITESGITATVAPSQAYLIELVSASEEPEPSELAIVTQPASYEGNVGDTVEFTVEATGEGLTYQWYYLAVGGEAWQKSYSAGATTDTLTVELRAYRDGQAYYCVVTDANGEQVASDAVVMTLKVGEFAIVSQPASYAGAEGDTVTFTVVAEGDNLTYRWKYSTDGGQTWQNSWSEGYATDTLTVELKAYRNGQQYKCVVSNAAGDVIESDAASMSLKESAIEITAQPENAIVAAGETVTFTVEATGENLKYRWYRSNDGETWVETWLAGYNTNELSFMANTSRAGYAYKCVITSNATTVETEAVSVVIG